MVLVTIVYVFRRFKINIYRTGQSAWWCVAVLRMARRNATHQKRGSYRQSPIGSSSLARCSGASDA